MIRAKQLNSMPDKDSRVHGEGLFNPVHAAQREFFLRAPARQRLQRMAPKCRQSMPAC